MYSWLSVSRRTGTFSSVDGDLEIAVPGEPRQAHARVNLSSQRFASSAAGSRRRSCGCSCSGGGVVVGVVVVVVRSS